MAAGPNGTETSVNTSHRPFSWNPVIYRKEDKYRILNNEELRNLDFSEYLNVGATFLNVLV